MPIADTLVHRLHRQANAARWRVSADRFRQALDASSVHAFGERSPGPREVGQHLGALHLEDLALACACADGDELAWEHFVREQRPVLYRAADALDPSGGARELADALYAELFGVNNRSDGRRSLFRHFHGRSSLSTWLRAVLAQRYVDRLRATRRLSALPSEDSSAALVAPERPIDPSRDRDVRVIQDALASALAALASRDRLRLAYYYAQNMTLAQTGRLLGEHEATASRHLARTRRAIRESVEHHLRTTAGLSDAAIAQCFASVAEDAGPLDMGDMFGVSNANEPPEP